MWRASSRRELYQDYQSGQVKFSRYVLELRIQSDVYILKKEKTTLTFIPTSLFRDRSLIRGFYVCMYGHCQTWDGSKETRFFEKQQSFGRNERSSDLNMVVTDISFQKFRDFSPINI